METVNYLKNKYNTSILDAMDTMVLKSLFSFDSLNGTLEETQLDVLQDVLYLYKNKETVKICELCKRSELMVDNWYANNICMNCYTRRNNRSRIQELCNLR